jgi:folate-dependent phosphoribosylglycinamide formyltransferase PurN
MADLARISVLCSGTGTNLQALIDACAGRRSPRIPGHIVKVTVNKKNAYSKERAEKEGIPTDYFNLVKDKFLAPGEKDAQKVKEARSGYDAALAERILAAKPDLIVLAGFMHVLSPSFLTPVKAAGVNIINLHPALPGCYDGAGGGSRNRRDQSKKRVLLQGDFPGLGTLAGRHPTCPPSCVSQRLQPQHNVFVNHMYVPKPDRHSAESSLALW